MEVSKILAEYDAMLAAGRRREAGEFLSEAADAAAREDDAVSEASLRGELTGYWRVFGEPEKSFASAERALELLEGLGLSQSAEYATALLNYATAKTAFRQIDEALALYARVEEIYEQTIAADDYRFGRLPLREPLQQHGAGRDARGARCGGLRIFRALSLAALARGRRGGNSNLPHEHGLLPARAEEA